MPEPDSAPVTVLLKQWRDGDRAALDLLTPIVYDELRRLAASYLRRERSEHTLQPTALLHEAYVKLASQREQNFESRAQFFGLASHLMRLILVDHARGKRSEKRGGGAKNLPLEEVFARPEERSDLVVGLDDALRELAAFDERKAKVIEMRFFGGMTVEETAHALSIGVATVGREQRMAEAWIKHYLSGEK